MEPENDYRTDAERASAKAFLDAMRATLPPESKLYRPPPEEVDDALARIAELSRD